MNRKRLIVKTAVLVVSGALSMGFAHGADTVVSVTLSPQSPGVTIPADFVGISYEGRILLPDAAGGHFLTQSNTPLLTMFRTLGVKSIRVGGNSSELFDVNPTDADRTGLFNFARTAGISVIFNLRTKTSTGVGANPNNEPQQVAIASTILRDHSDVLQAFELANEPDSSMTWSVYKGLIDKVLADIAKQPNGTKARYTGPSATSGAVSTFPGNFAKAYALRGDIKFVSQHWYPAGDRNSVTDVVAKRAEMLNTATMHAKYSAFYDKFVPAVTGQNLRYRLEETNSLASGGKEEVSDTYTASLWMLDYMHWWATRSALGVNVHSGQNTVDKPNFYTAITPAVRSSTYTARPVAYGMKAFDLGGHGRVVPVQLSSGSLDMNAYGVLGSDGSLYVTLINKSFGSGASNAKVTINPGAIYAAGQVWLMQAPANNIAAKTGMTLGGAAILGDGTWSGAPGAVPHGTGQSFTITVPPASAAVVKLK
ncbi:MAG: hypothetical protein JWL63_1650 [Rhodocyclales bacterium]|nr:hypothetical protein [Rhodocyclales bacterium]